MQRVIQDRQGQAELEALSGPATALVEGLPGIRQKKGDGRYRATLLRTHTARVRRSFKKP